VRHNGSDDRHLGVLSLRGVTVPHWMLWTLAPVVAVLVIVTAAL